jgi:hypothetical protein
MVKRFLLFGVASLMFLSVYAIHLLGQTGGGPRDVEDMENWYLLNLHQHVWDGREWGRDKVDYKTVFDVMFNGSYSEFDGVLINDQLPTQEEKERLRGYVAEKYPEKLYLVGGHYHVQWRGEELSITLILPSSNSSLLPEEYYDCEKITGLSFETIARDVHGIGGLLIWDHPYRNLDSFTKGEIDALMDLFDGIELASVRGPRGAGTLTKEELDNYWRIIKPYVLAGKVFPAGVTDYSAYLGMPERRGAFWVNKDYGTLVKAYSKDEGSVLAALKGKRAVVILRSRDGELLIYGKPEFAEEVRETFYSGTLR